MNMSTKPSIATGYSIPIGYLRTWATLLVVAHHAVLAYHPDAPKPGAPLDGPNRWWGAFPVVDPAKWQGFSLFTTANDIYFMSLMFLLSGLFVWPSFRRRMGGLLVRVHKTGRVGLGPGMVPVGAAGV